MYFVYFTNYFCVCIFVYLLTINFVRVFSKYRVFVYYNKFHYQLRTNCTYLSILHSMHMQLQYKLLLLCTCAVYSTFLNTSTDTVSYAVSEQIFSGRGKGQNPVIKTLLTTGIICNFISIQSQTFWILPMLFIPHF